MHFLKLLEANFPSSFERSKIELTFLFEKRLSSKPGKPLVFKSPCSSARMLLTSVMRCSTWRNWLEKNWVPICQM